MKSAQEINQYILTLEKNYPVNSWKVNGVRIWPFIRIKLSADLNFSQNKEFARKSQVFNAKPSNSKLKTLKNSISSYKKLSPAKYLFTSSYAHRAFYNNQYWNKFYDPIIEDANIKSFITIEHNSKNYYQNISSVKNHTNLFFFEDFHFSTDVIQSKLQKLRLSKIIKQSTLNKYIDFVEQLKTDGYLKSRAKNYQKNNLKKQLTRLFLMEKTYSKLLTKIKPQVVFEVCYYSMNSLALNLACKKLHIPTVEFQHGPQPPLHLAYSNWHTLSPYKLQPSVFWEWDKASQNTLNNWIIKGEHKTIVNGNPWLSLFQNIEIDKKSESILYSLQPFANEKLFPPFIIKFIQENEYEWILRVHPTDFNRINEIEQFLTQKNLISKVVISGKNQPPLPEQVTQSFVHITNTSGCAIEAKILGVKTIFIDSLAKNYFKEMITTEDGYFSDGHNFTELVERIFENNERIKTSIKRPKQMMDDVLKLLNKK